MQLHKNTIIAFLTIGLIAVCSMLYIVYWGNLKNSDLVRQITLAEISSHNTKESCWTTINEEVFDVTKFVTMHKGGDRILAACGVDATDLFTGKSPLGRVHSQMATKLLNGMKIGTLQK